MVAISFSVFLDKIKNGEKTQTIRPYSDHRYEQLKKVLNKKGHLQLYWKQRDKDGFLISYATLKELYRFYFRKDYIPQTDDYEYFTIVGLGADGRPFIDSDEELARRDGFNSFEEMVKWFRSRYGELDGREFIIIRWELDDTTRLDEFIKEE